MKFDLFLKQVQALLNSLNGFWGGVNVNNKAFIKWYKKEKHTYRSAAKVLNVTEGSVWRWVNGFPPNIKTAIKIEKILKIPAMSWFN
jgi:hypothetical protein